MVVLDFAAGALATVVWVALDQVTILAAVGGILVSLAANQGQGLYRSYTSGCRSLTYAGLMRSALLASLMTWLVSASSGEVPTVGSGAVATTTLFLAAASGRHAFDYWLSGRRTAGDFRRPVVVVARSDEAALVLALVGANPSIGLDAVGLVGPRVGEIVGGVVSEGPAEAAASVAARLGATGALVCPAGLPPTSLHAAVRELERAGVHLHVSCGLPGIAPRRLRSVEVAHEPFLYLAPPRLTWWQIAAKRTMDVVLATLVLVITSPVLLAAAIAVKVQDGGPVLFRQERVGRGGAMFRIHKLRTMEVGAEHRLDEVRHLNERVGPLFKVSDDPRVTRLGRFLRATSIDELPQLLDVLHGTMSLVGPRPPLPFEAAAFPTDLLDRFGVRPGITGLWQVEGRDAADFEVYRRLDLFYVENWSLLLDLGVLLDTLPAVLGRSLEVLRPPAPSPVGSVAIDAGKVSP